MQRMVDFESIDDIVFPQMNDEQILKDKVASFYLLAERLFNRTFPRPVITFDLNGKVGGYACYDNVGLRKFRVNRQLYIENTVDYLNQTVPHEVAHLIVKDLFPYRVMPHGKEWKSVMRKFGVEPKRCHTYEVTPARQHKKFEYVCKCSSHFVGLNIHNKIGIFGKTYTCKKCKNQIKFKTGLTNLVH